MKPVLLQFDTLSLLAEFSRGVNDRGYVIVVKDLTMQLNLTDKELRIAIEQYGAKLLPVNRAAA